MALIFLHPAAGPALMVAAGWACHATVLHRRLSAARRDALTELPLRLAYMAAAQQLVDRHRDEALIVLADANGLKAINDELGHAAGDQAIIETARRLHSWTGRRGVAARLGGDEFAAAVRVSRDQRGAELDRLANLLSQPIRIIFPGGADIEVPASAALGAAAIDTVGARRVDGDRGLLRAADVAMYRSKTHRLSYAFGTSQDAAQPGVNGRRAGRAGTHHSVEVGE